MSNGIDFAEYGEPVQKAPLGIDFSAYGDLAGEPSSQIEQDYKAAKGKIGESVKSARSRLAALLGYTPGFDPSGIRDMAIRARLGASDTPQEAISYLEELAGAGQVSQDPYGRLAVSPSGMRAMGLMAPPSGLPTLVEEPWVSGYDIADVIGDIPEILGAIGGGMMASGAGFLPGMLASGGGAAAGKLLGEAGESALGINTQDIGSIASDVAESGLLGAAGEGMYRGLLRPIGRAIAAPGAPPSTWWTGKSPSEWMDPERVRLVRQAEDMGALPDVTQRTGHPTIGRVQQAAENFMGRPRDKYHAALLQREMTRLESLFASGATSEQAGIAVKDAIRSGRREMSEWAKRQTAELDSFTGGAKTLPTEGFKTRLRNLLAQMPKTRGEAPPDDSALIEWADTMISNKPMSAPAAEAVERAAKGGKPIGVPSETLAEIRKLANIEDYISFEQWQRVRTDIRRGIDEGTLMPGMGSRDAKLMRDAVDGILDDAEKAGTVNQGLAARARRFRSDYAEKADTFGSAAIERLARNERYAGHIPPEDVVNFVVRAGEPSRARRVMNLLPEGTKNDVRKVAMADILGSVTATSPKDQTQLVFKGARFLDELDKKWGKETLNAVFGKENASALYKFAETQALLSEKQAMIAGLAVANVALHPWKKLPQVVEWNLLQKAFMNPSFMRYMTEGIKAPKTRAGLSALSRAAAQASLMLEEETAQ